MRRLVPTLALTALALAACAAPRVTLDARYLPGEVRTYRLTATSEAELDAGNVQRTETTTLEATSRVQVLASSGERSVLRLTVVPVSLTRDGRSIPPPGRQQAEVVLGAGGELEKVTSVGGVSADLVATDLGEIAPLVASPLPGGPVRLGDTWTRPLPPPEGAERGGTQRGRVSALRVVDGFDSVILDLEVRRPIVRTSQTAGQTLELRGDELSAVQIAFAFGEGFPVVIESAGRGSFAVGGVAGSGTVALKTRTKLVLLERKTEAV